ncbi:putative ABC transporter permease protein [Phycisphaera mikurensis NBRC 102666]|uniref:Putative ABC transporter permease protein n=1 Tax=Phycisphaera mikurensis (strain NBRC 102666 / KCTC 22515 / FYK2301M01) TaxID=1142394 RepID=I0IHG0_PHYMF|nr:putative ABC transporter permease protein [Phycisphaera mikurensis NBRC 102666]
MPQVGRLATTHTVTGAAAPQAPAPIAEVPGSRPTPSNQPRAAERARALAKAASLHIVLTALGLILFLPFLYMFLTSVKDLSQVGLRSWIPSTVVTTDAGQFGEERLAALHGVIQEPAAPAEHWLSARFGELIEPTPAEASTVLNRLINDGADALALPAEDVAAAASASAAAEPPADPASGTDAERITLDGIPGPFDAADLRLPEAGFAADTPGARASAEAEAALQRAEAAVAAHTAFENGLALAPEGERAAARSEGLELRAAAAEAAQTLRSAWTRVRGHQLAAALPAVVPEPTAFRWHNYLQVFRDIPFGRFYMNSLFVAAWVTFLQLFTSSMAAFSFSRLRWKGRDQVFLLYLATMMLPGLVLMIPNYQIMISLRLVDTLVGLILPAAFTAFGTFLLRQFMMGIPASLDEAAEIDGASKWRVYWDVILPLARPGLVTLAIFTFMGTYNSFFWPLVMLKSEHRYTLPIGILAFDTSAGQQTNLMMAAITMTIVPMIIVFVLLQKQLVKGIQLGAVKG